MEREVIRIDEQICTGCGLCIPGCPEGALQIIDGKARLISDLFCDGLGACIGECPEGAIHIEKREADSYDERMVMENIIKAGSNTVEAHLTHLKAHGENVFLKTAIDLLKEKKMPVPPGFTEKTPHSHGHAAGGCPGSQIMDFSEKSPEDKTGDVSSRLSQWPVQLHLVSPMAPYYLKSDVVLAADCTAFAVGDFHQRFIKGHTLAIACPKLDEGQDIYLAKLKALIEKAGINTLTVIIMQVPCCDGLLRLARKAAELSSRNVPLKKVVVGIRGEILQEEWI